MKNILKTALFGIALTTSLMGYPHNSSADDTTTEPTAPKHHRHFGFGLGVCVGQTLGGTPGEKSSDPAAFRAAVESCKAQFKAKKAAAEAATSNNS